jgi:hypothetical protein
VLLCLLSWGFWTVWRRGWRYLSSTTQLIPSLQPLQPVFVKCTGQVSFRQEAVCRDIFSACVVALLNRMQRPEHMWGLWGSEMGHHAVWYVATFCLWLCSYNPCPHSATSLIIFLHGVLFYPEQGISGFLQNAGKFLSGNMVSHVGVCSVHPCWFWWGTFILW